MAGFHTSNQQVAVMHQVKELTWMKNDIEFKMFIILMRMEIHSAHLTEFH